MGKDKSRVRMGDLADFPFVRAALALALMRCQAVRLELPDGTLVAIVHPDGHVEVIANGYLGDPNLRMEWSEYDQKGGGT